MNRTHFSSITEDVNSRHVECVCIANGVPLKDVVVSMQPVIRTFLQWSAMWGGLLHLKEKINWRLINDKYPEGNMKSFLAKYSKRTGDC